MPALVCREASTQPRLHSVSANQSPPALERAGIKPAPRRCRISAVGPPNAPACFSSRAFSARQVV